MQCYQEYEEAGTDLAQGIGKKDAIAKLKAMPNEVALALGKLSSGLYVVTAQGQSDARSAMIASWVAQASFEPLGLTIAVAKDRAIESLMQVRRAAPPPRPSQRRLPALRPSRCMPQAGARLGGVQ